MIINKFKKEFLNLVIILIITIIIFKITFYKSNIFVIFRLLVVSFYLFVLPGYFIITFFSPNSMFLERVIIGTSLGAISLGGISYYLAELGWLVNYQWPLPLFIIGIALVAIWRQDLKLK